MCESDADGSFLHENWNKDLRLFSDGEDGGQHLLQVFFCSLLTPMLLSLAIFSVFFLLIIL